MMYIYRHKPYIMLQTDSTKKLQNHKYILETVLKEHHHLVTFNNVTTAKYKISNEYNANIYFVPLHSYNNINTMHENFIKTNII